MIFENLLINNFGVYSGKQNFDLTTEIKKPVILIGALNGSGKTTFLQAIDFVLYGKFSNYFNSQKLSYENFLIKNVNKQNFDEGAQIELIFSRKYKGKKQKFKLSRNWKVIGKKMKEEFFVFIDDQYDEDITKDWDNFVDQILPSRVASLFFFDGEKIEQLADLDQSKQVLKKAINSLLGLEIVDQLNIDVDEFQRRSMLKIKDEGEVEAIKSIEKETSVYERQLKEIDEKITKAEDEQSKLLYELRQTDIALSQKGIAYYEKKKEYEKEQQDIQQKIDEINQQLIKLASGDAPLLILKDEVQELLSQSISVNQSNNHEQNKKRINILLEKFEKFSKQNSKDENFLSKLDQFINDNKISDPINQDNHQHLLPSLNYQDLNFLINESFVNVESEISKLILNKKKLDEQFEKISQLINKIPSDEEIKPLIEKYNEQKKEESIMITKINVLNDQRKKINGPLIKLNIELRKEYEKKTTKDLVDLDNKRFIDYSYKVKDVLSSFHVKALT